MDDIHYEKILNRIIQGRLRIRLGDLVLFVEEPSTEIKEASFEVYEEAYDKAYFAGCYVEQEILEILVNYDLWTPNVDKRLKELEKKEEELKLQAFKSFFRKRELAGVKRSIRMSERERAKCVAQKEQLNHLSCKGVATFARRMWLLSQTCKTQDGNVFDFQANGISVKTVMDLYTENEIQPGDIRWIARNYPWRQMWTGSKKRSAVFNRSPIDLDKNQLALLSYSQMYDNVYENPDHPKQEIIDDDDALDGWFIFEHRKIEKEKKAREADAAISSNSKIANSQEIMLVANSQEEAQEIYGLNPDHSRGIIRQRQEQIQNSDGNLNFKDLHDVKQERFMNAVNQGTQAIKSKGR